MLSDFSIIFPLAAALFVLFWFFRWVRLHKEPLPMEEEDTGTGHITKKDGILMGALAVVYGIVAFTALGQNVAPQTFLHYEDANYYALIELNEPQEITRIQYYCGLAPADYTLEFSLDGENWVAQVQSDGTSGMTHTYTQVFRWNDAVLNDYNGTVRYVRIISGGAQDLGEVAIYGADGHRLTAEEMTVASGCEALTDEPDTVPDSYDYTNGTYFDEIYFPRTAYEMIQNVWPYEITHPPLGKAIISLGIRLFGMTPFGWRFMGVLFGILMLPVLYVLLKKMFRHTAVALCGSTVFAFDFMHYVQTRLATIDTYAVFFILCMYLFMYLWLTEPDDRPKRRLLWLGLAGLSFGLGAASKWTCIYAGGGLAVLWLVYWVVRFVREPEKPVSEFIGNAAWCVLFFVLAPCVIYYVSYWTYAPSQGVTGGISRLFKKDYLKIVIDNQKYMWNYHSDLVATHPYSSKWYQWILDIRPILYYAQYFEDGTKSVFGCFSNPVVCWGGLAAMGGMAWVAVRDRDNKALFILIGYLANFLPWVLVSRLTFAYHYFPATVFLVLALGYLFADIVRRSDTWKRPVYGFTGVTVALFCMFYPVLSGARVSESYSAFLSWFADMWPF